MKTSEITDTKFREAVEAIDSGNITALQRLVEIAPELVTRRLDFSNRRLFCSPLSALVCCR